MPMTLRSGRDYDGRGYQPVMDLDAQAKQDANNPPVEAAAQAEETQEPNPPAEEHFWPTLRKHALGKADPSERAVKGTCPICYTDLSIAGLPPPADGGKPAVIAPCGHVLCRDCWPKKQWDEEEVVRTSQRKCPMCRLLIECEHCGRGCIKQAVPDVTCDIEEVSVVPNMLTEGTLAYAPICFECSGVYVEWPHGWWYEPREPRPQ